MSTTTTLTVNTEARNYAARWHEKYDSEYKQGDAVEVCELSDGDSIIRRNHNITGKAKDIEKHFESVEDIWIDGDGVSHMCKINVTMTFEKGNISSRTRCNNLAAGYVAELPARISAINNGSLNR